MRRALCVLSLLVIGCGGDGDDAGPTPYESAGPHPVGHAAFTVTDSVRGRVLTSEVWYPAAESARAAAEAGVPIEELLPAGPERATFAGLLPAAPTPGTRRRTRSAPDAAPVAAPARLPVVVFSHCHQCLRFSSFSIAERLASHGIVVVAPDHQDNTLFDGLDGSGAALEDAFLTVRAGDISALLDAVLAEGAANPLPAVLRGRLDPTRVGMLGHSFGGATTGRVLQDDPRFIAGVTMGAPIQSPFFPSVTLSRITEPLLFVQLLEDNSIGKIGNDLMLGNFDDATQPVWLVRVADAGHWSVSDLCGITSAFPAGCISPAARQSDGASFTYLDIEVVRDLAASYVTAFFALHLSSDPGAAATLKRPLGPPGIVTLEARKP